MLGLSPKHQLERLVNLVTKTRIHIKFSSHIDGIEWFKTTLHLDMRRHIARHTYSVPQQINQHQHIT